MKQRTLRKESALPPIHQATLEPLCLSQMTSYGAASTIHQSFEGLFDDVASTIHQSLDQGGGGD
jgi:hypothetical protein